MTFNIELLLEIFKGFEGALFTDVRPSVDEYMSLVAEPNQVKLSAFKQLFADVDVACIQENVIVKRDTYVNLFQRIGNLDVAATCHSHLFQWAISKRLYGDMGKLSNSIYAKPEYINTFDMCDGLCAVPTMNNTPRCYSETTLRIQGAPISVASFHASGGRFDDMVALESDENAKKKIDQVNVMLQKKFDIICGDFNTKLYAGETDTEPYFQSLIKNWSTVSEDDKVILWNRYKTWMFGLDSIFKEAGYASAYGNEIGDTTAFGGTVDMIYYNPAVLNVQNVTKITDGVMGPASGNQKHTPILSDHFPVKVTFTLNR